MDIYKVFTKLSVFPRWVIIIIDLLLIICAASLGYLLRFNFNITEILHFHPQRGIFIIVLSCLAATFLTKSYAGIVRYTGIEDGFRILYTILLGFSMVVVLNLLYFYNYNHNLIPYSVLIISFFVSFLFLFYYRLLVKAVFTYFRGEIHKRIHVGIFGAGNLGMITKTILESDYRYGYKVVGFFEDDFNKVGKVILGVKIYSWKDFYAVCSQYNVKELIIAVRNLDTIRKNEIVEVCLAKQIQVRIIPSIERWVRGELKPTHLKQINIDDLLGREEIQMPAGKLYESFYNKRICVTGAAGSIGGELSKQLLSYSPKMLILIDQAETPLYNLEVELRERNYHNNVQLKFCLGDVSDSARMQQIFKKYKPEIIFHAAAYKHVPVMEANPSESVRVNIFGSKVIADLAMQHRAEKFVMISTDKAVNPTSIMGCCKRVAELYVQSLALGNHAGLESGTQFIITRFGNVLGSNGSVIPVFKRQIENGGPVTITHPDITRYFMTISESCRLVLEAGSMGSGGEIFIFDMGKPVKIVDLAKKMIKLSGLEPGKDIDILFTGLRDGEKLQEELFTTNETLLPTHHPKILKARTEIVNPVLLQHVLDNLAANARDKESIVYWLKQIVPEAAIENHSLLLFSSDRC